MRNVHKILVEKAEGKRTRGVIVEERIILKWILKYGVRMRTGSG
jgi:hypothetical protein